MPNLVEFQVRRAGISPAFRISIETYDSEGIEEEDQNYSSIRHCSKGFREQFRRKLGRHKSEAARKVMTRPGHDTKDTARNRGNPTLWQLAMGMLKKDRVLSAASIIGEPGAFGERLDWSSAPSSG